MQCIYLCIVRTVFCFAPPHEEQRHPGKLFYASKSRIRCLRKSVRALSDLGKFDTSSERLILQRYVNRKALGSTLIAVGYLYCLFENSDFFLLHSVQLFLYVHISLLYSFKQPKNMTFILKTIDFLIMGDGHILSRHPEVRVSSNLISPICSSICKFYEITTSVCIMKRVSCSIANKTKGI